MELADEVAARKALQHPDGEARAADAATRETQCRAIAFVAGPDGLGQAIVGRTLPCAVSLDEMTILEFEHAREIERLRLAHFEQAPAHPMPERGGLLHVAAIIEQSG